MQITPFTRRDVVPIESGTAPLVPAPAPESLALDATTIELLATAQRALGQLKGTVRSIDPHIARYQISWPRIFREARASRRLAETEGDPHYEGPPPRTFALLEDRNYALALNVGAGLLEKHRVDRLLLEKLLSILSHGDRASQAGETRLSQLRTVQSVIGAHGLRDTRAAPPPAAIVPCLDDLEEYIHPAAPSAAVPQLVRVALAHYQFMAIQPFAHGNGRLGRLLIPLLLCAYGRIDRPAVGLSARIERERDRYGDVLLRASHAGDFLPWVAFFLEAIAESAHAAIASADALAAVQREYREKLSSLGASLLLFKLVDALFKREWTTVEDAAELLEVTPGAASANLRKLVEAGILVEVKEKHRRRRFVAEAIRAAADVDGTTSPDEQT